MKSIPRANKESDAFLRSMLPVAPDIKVRPMFGNVSAFVNGNMCAGVYGADLFVRLPEAEAAELLRASGASAFEPMKGRPMKGYVLVPRAWEGDAAKVRPWVSKAIESARKMPPKGKG